MQIHTVASGETLSSIASQYGITPQLLINLNNPPDPNSLVVGQTLVVRIPVQTYVIRQGDTLNSIAVSNGISVNTLLQNNPQLIGNTLPIGETIAISYDDDKSRFIAVNGYTYANIDRDLLLTTLPYLTFLTIFTYGFNEDGTLIPSEDTELITIAKNYGVAPLMLISTLTSSGSFSNELAHLLLNDIDLQYILIENIVLNMKEKGYYGLDIDFEFIPPEDRQGYINFVNMVTQRLNSEGFITLVALAPKTSVDQPGLLYESHDYHELGLVANLALAMTYEWGYTYGPPMAVSPLNKVEEVIAFAVNQIEPQKLLMGMPLYGYDWPLPYVANQTRARSISPQEAIELASRYNVEISFDNVSMTPYFYYTAEDGIEHVVWFDDASSVEAKLGLVTKYNLAGASYWNLIKAFPQNWQVLVSLFNIARVL